MSMIGKDDIAASVAERLGMTKAKAQEAVSAVVDEIAGNLTDGTDVRLRGLGTFSVKATNARKGKNPATGEPINIPAGKKVAFKIASDLKGAL